MLESKKIQPLQVSKWIKIPFLVDADEMENLFEEMPAFKIYEVGSVTRKGEGIHPPSIFLEKYRVYVECLKKGQIPHFSEFRLLFSSVWSLKETALFSMPADEERRLIKVHEPCVQIQHNQIRFDPEEKVFRTQVYSSDSISWGIQAGFPHVYLDPETYQTGKTRDFENMDLFLAFQRWIRKATSPTPFVVGGEKVVAPIRLGKKCFAWINEHPQLRASGICVECR